MLQSAELHWPGKKTESFVKFSRIFYQKICFCLYRKMDDQTERPDNVMNVAEELILVMANDKSDKSLLDNIIKEWQKIYTIRELFNEQCKQNLQGMVIQTANVCTKKC